MAGITFIVWWFAHLDKIVVIGPSNFLIVLMFMLVIALGTCLAIALEAAFQGVIRNLFKKESL